MPAAELNAAHRQPGYRYRRRLVAAVTAMTLTIATAVSIVVATPATATSAAARVQVGAGSYTTDPVGPLPTGCGDLSTDPRQFLTSNAPTGPIPTNDWWSSLVFKKLNCQYSEALQAHPAAYLPNAGGLGFSYTTTPQLVVPGPGLQEYHYAYSQDFTAGVTGLSAPVVKVDGWSDWTVTPSWNDGARSMTATIGHGLPMTYFKVAGGGAQLTLNAIPRIWLNAGATIGFTVNGHDYVAYAPTGAGWNVAGSALTSTLAGKGYYTVAVLPTTTDSTDSERKALASRFGSYAFAVVTGSTVRYRYNPASSTVTTTYGFTTRPAEGTETRTVTALYQHQWKSLTGATPIAQQYVSPRGPMKVLVGVSQFSTSMKFHGVLPEVPAVGDSTGADRATLDGYLQQVADDPMAQQKSDTYWAGKGLGRAARIAEIADQVGETSIRDSALASIRQTLTDWFTASPGKAEQVFYYDKNWGTLIGYPASYGSDQELNDHHFHYGYFIAAAATLARFDPAWAAGQKYGGMVDLLIRDANNYDRADPRFPYLRDFDIYAGHDWASGHGAFAAGNNQESSSEGMNFANALIQWGQVTGNTAVRDAGIFIYTTQAAAIQQYWFDVDGSTFPAGWQHTAVGMVWGDGGSYATWFSPDPEKIQGINMLPITGGHLYLGYRPQYVKKNYQEIVTRSGGAPRVWQDIIGEFLATGDPATALANYRRDSSFVPEEGESKAHTFHWIRNLAALGVIDTSVTANNPLAVVFAKNGARTYVAANVGSQSQVVTYSDGTRLTVPAGRTATSGAITWSGGGGSGAVTEPGNTVSPSAPPPSSVPSSSIPPSSVSPSSVSPSSSASSGSPPSGPAPSGQPGLPTTRFLGASGQLKLSDTPAFRLQLRSADGATRDGEPYHPATFTAGGLTGDYVSGSTAFSLAVDSGTSVGNAVQVRVSYDLTANGSWDRVETYKYFPTDPVVGAETYLQSRGLLSATGHLGDLENGAVRVEVWSVLPGAGVGPPSLVAGSSITLPY
ncbi:MAG: glycosyl hydrolase [Nakamurella sp.]